MLKRSVVLIVLFASIVLIAGNLVLFTITQNGETGNDWLTQVQFGVNGVYEFRGFQYLYQYVSTFPGLTNSFNVVNTVANTITGQFTVSGNNIIDVIFGIFYVLLTPISLFVTFVIDLFNNVVWIFGFFIPNF